MAAAVDEQEAKRRRIEEDGGKEVEADAPADGRPRHKAPVGFHLRDCTLNIVPMQGGRLLAPLTDGGLQYLVAGARANVGVKKGRYCFEVKIIELMSPSEPVPVMHRDAVPQPKQLLRVGFATSGSPLFLGETSESVCFDSEGMFTAEGKREAKGERFARDQMVAVVLNLGAGANTVSLFRDGRRCCAPLPLPEGLVGKTLFPTINFRNITVQVNFGPTPAVPLPFVCRGIQDIAAEDAQAAPPDVAAGGKYEVVVPVGIPDEGTFEWLDEFMAKNAQYTELSDRAIIRWAESSGMKRTPGATWKHSNDKPDVKFNIPMMDDSSVRRVLNSVIATQPRNYVVMEVKANLMESERAELLKRFNFPCYKKVAQVTVGDPPKEFVAKVHEALLKRKQEELERGWSQRKAERERKNADAEAKAAQAKAVAKEEPKDVEMKAEDGGAKKEEDGVKEEGEKMEVKEEPKEEEKAPEEPEEPKPVATLSEEEKALRFTKQSAPDLTAWVLGTQFTKFSLPGASDGFDEVRFSWSAAAEAEAYFKTWMLKQNILNRIEELQPGEWFKAKLPEWQKAVAEWRQKQADWKDPSKAAARRAAKEAAEAAKKQAEEAEKKAAEAEKQAEEGEKKEDAEEEQKTDEGDKPKAEEAPKEEEAAPAEVASALTVADILDIGDGEPLFANFALEDWILLSLRFELFVMARSFAKDAGDPERAGIHESHIGFYYNKYFRKTFSVKSFGRETVAQVIDLVKDCVSLAEGTEVLATELAEDPPLDLFVRHTEQQRRLREQAINSGDESARLKFNTTPEAPPPAPGLDVLGKGVRAAWSSAPPPPPQSWYGGAKGGPYGGYKGGSIVGGPRTGGQPQCRQWLSGRCQYGTTCRYAHA